MEGERVVRWEEPPPARPSQRWVATVWELKQRPGEWALVCEDVTTKYAYNTAAQSLRRYGCEATCSSVNGRAKVWARWPNGDHAPS